MRRGISLWKLGQSITRRCIAQTDIKKPTVAGRRFFASESELKKTALYDFHVENGGKMVPFAGWSMPIQYKDSIMDSTLNFRANGSLFDVAGLVPGNGTLTVFTNEKGGAIDDSVITKVKDDHIYLVVNAGCRDKDLAHIESHMKAFKAKGGGVDWYIHDERSLLALQTAALSCSLLSFERSPSHRISLFSLFPFSPLSHLSRYPIETSISCSLCTQIETSDFFGRSANLTISKPNERNDFIVENEIDTTSNSSRSQKDVHMKRTLTVWNDFHYVEMNGVWTAICNHCSGLFTGEEDKFGLWWRE